MSSRRHNSVRPLATSNPQPVDYTADYLMAFSERATLSASLL